MVKDFQQTVPYDDEMWENLRAEVPGYAQGISSPEKFAMYEEIDRAENEFKNKSSQLSTDEASSSRASSNADSHSSSSSPCSFVVVHEVFCQTQGEKSDDEKGLDDQVEETQEEEAKKKGEEQEDK